MTTSDAFGRTIQLFLVDGDPNGLIIASIHGWTGSVLVSTQSTFGRLLARPELNRTGVYILFGPDPEDALRSRAYIGEADSVRDRIDNSARKRGFWETAVVITTSDETLTKGLARYLEARIIELTNAAGRVALDNAQVPEVDRRRLPEADRANMEAFLASLRIVLPVIGLDLLKARPRVTAKAAGAAAPTPAGEKVRFEVQHSSGVKAYAEEVAGEFVVLEGSQALKDAGYAHNSYARLKQELIDNGVLRPTSNGRSYEFAAPYSFRSPSAAGAVVLDRNTNGRTRWHVVGTRLTYHEWQEGKGNS
jgi:Domain of unknown function (DUF4357)